MRRIVVVLLILLFCLSPLVFGAEIKFTLTAAKLDRVIEAVNGLYPKEDESMTDAQWAKEYYRRKIVHDVYLWELKKAQENVSVSHDDDLLQ